MMYTSTRGGVEAQPFSDIVLAGLASDSGLYIPVRIPRIGQDTIRNMQRMSYPEIAEVIMTTLAPDIPAAWWKSTLHDVYKPTVFGNHAYPPTGGDPMLPIRCLQGGLYVADLSTGPTLAFKDWALQLLARLFVRVTEGKRFTVIGATSGDTGSAAIEALKGLDIPVFMLSPEHGMSEFQKAQMYGVRDAQIHNLAIRGSFDECQNIVKELNNDVAFKRAYGVGAVNSINWARIAAQVAYHYSIYASMGKVHQGRTLDMVVPSGNFGNAYSCMVARAMGLPIGRITIATNANDVLYEFWKTGVYRPRAKTITTVSPSMDITAASNIERFIHDVFYGDATVVANLYEHLKEHGSFDISYKLNVIRAYMDAATTTEEECASTIRAVYDRDQVIIDPHTAVAMSVAERYRRPNVPTVVLSTAQPCKFDETILRIIGTAAPRPPAFKDVESRERFVTTLDADVQSVKQFVIDTLAK